MNSIQHHPYTNVTQSLELDMSSWVGETGVQLEAAPWKLHRSPNGPGMCSGGRGEETLRDPVSGSGTSHCHGGCLSICSMDGNCACSLLPPVLSPPLLLGERPTLSTAQLCWAKAGPSNQSLPLQGCPCPWGPCWGFHGHVEMPLCVDVEGDGQFRRPQPLAEETRKEENGFWEWPAVDASVRSVPSIFHFWVCLLWLLPTAKVLELREDAKRAKPQEQKQELFEGWEWLQCQLWGLLASREKYTGAIVLWEAFLKWKFEHSVTVGSIQQKFNSTSC